MPTPADLLAVARPLAEEAGRQLVAALASERTITTKTTATDLVTEMDAWAEQFLSEGLLAARPDDSVRGEEGVDHRG
ncbi:MAG TPA: inositol monophosphatase family protein, partial [Acidimicrobiales bacterium]